MAKTHMPTYTAYAYTSMCEFVCVQGFRDQYIDCCLPLLLLSNCWLSLPFPTSWDLMPMHWALTFCSCGSSKYFTLRLDTESRASCSGRLGGKQTTRVIPILQHFPNLTVCEKQVCGSYPGLSLLAKNGSLPPAGSCVNFLKGYLYLVVTTDSRSMKLIYRKWANSD